MLFSTHCTLFFIFARKPEKLTHLSFRTVPGVVASQTHRRHTFPHSGLRHRRFQTVPHAQETRPDPAPHIHQGVFVVSFMIDRNRLAFTVSMFRTFTVLQLLLLGWVHGTDIHEEQSALLLLLAVFVVVVVVNKIHERDRLVLHVDRRRTAASFAERGFTILHGCFLVASGAELWL